MNIQALVSDSIRRTAVRDVQTATVLYTAVLTAIIVTTGAVLSIRKWIISPLAERVNEYHKRLGEVEEQQAIMLGKMERLIVLETKVSVFWSILEKNAGSILHRDDTPDIDRLLERLPSSNLTEAEQRELLGYLHAIQKGSRSNDDKMAAMILEATVAAQLIVDAMDNAAIQELL